ncbi:hypothetical protein CONCODRAFT_18156 [Conidiobolus coronatus NRRL 28638]|uniref:MFS general substrate transporter n=1 Tax=Conidiobolus coronatus (strain ATCC 28846 / CBS 209.66 / NRRL 28638) TaxID=796925 RepID=A0A137P3W3_CONC2|nr:hypothetical protein CONCODRAFT_18156 [Conidiobolus coronatus NRRL 28638]|eukprot:KXN69703.1 hypothetical protein CONCODRAFT_18156 [Conidiobolus coronatus NRRL 28638]
MVLKKPNINRNSSDSANSSSIIGGYIYTEPLDINDTRITKLPKKLTNSIYLLKLIKPFTLGLILSLNYLLLTEFKQISNSLEIIFYSSLIISLFYLGQSISTLIWSGLSKNFSRKTLTLSSYSAACLVLLGFGYSKKLQLSLIFVGLLGLLSGIEGIVNTMLYDLTDSTNLNSGFLPIGVYSTMGNILGLLTGFGTSNPIQKFPLLFNESDTLLKNYPYFLPCAISSYIIGVIILVNYIYLDNSVEYVKYQCFNNNNNTNYSTFSAISRITSNSSNFNDNSFTSSIKLISKELIWASIQESVTNLMLILLDITLISWTLTSSFNRNNGPIVIHLEIPLLLSGLLTSSIYHFGLASANINWLNKDNLTLILIIFMDLTLIALLLSYFTSIKMSLLLFSIILIIRFILQLFLQSVTNLLLPTQIKYGSKFLFQNSILKSLDSLMIAIGLGLIAVLTVNYPFNKVFEMFGVLPNWGFILVLLITGLITNNK